MATVRFRVTASATVLVAVVLALAAVGVVVFQRASMLSSLDTSLAGRADAIAAELAVSIPDEIPNANAEDRLVQLVGADATVLAASPNLRDVGAIAGPPAAREAYGTVTDLPIEDDSFRVISRSIETPAGPATLHVGENIDDLSDSIRTLWISLAITVPVVVAALAFVAWWMVGRTLEPVDAIRRQVESIAGDQLNRRVPVPATDDEVAELAVTMNSMLNRIERSARRQRQFTGDASHELRTPLTRIRTLLETRGNGDGLDRESVEILLEETTNLEHLVRDLLYLAETDEKQVQRRLLDLDDLVLREVESVRLTSGMTIDASQVSGALVEGNPGQLTSAIRNLLENGVRHARAGVSVALTEQTGSVVLRISDDGPGIPVEERDRVFDRFARLDPARGQQAGGIGLGLAIAKSVVVGHGGNVIVEESAAGGARFVVTLPAAAP